MKKRFGQALAVAALSAALAVGSLLPASASRAADVIDYDTITEALATDFSQAAQLPLTGWFSRTFEDGRSVKAYFSEEAEIRTYFTIVAVPDGVDTVEFIQKDGWKDMADAQGEALFVLEPGAEGWGTPEEEAAYMEEAIGFLSGTRNGNNIPVFSTFGEHYVVGYGKGAAALEYWAAQNPILVIAQAYIGGESAGSAALDKISSEEYTGKNANGDITDVLEETLEKVGIAGKMAPKDVPVPTMLIGYTGSEDHWKAANDCNKEPYDTGIYLQNIDSDAYATDYANKQRKEAGSDFALSEVCIVEEAPAEERDPMAGGLYSWMSRWTRYDTTFAYSNALAERLNYQEARVAAQQQAKDGAVKETLSNGTEIWGEADKVIEGHGTIKVGVIAFADNSGDGKNDPREYVAYIPEGFEDKELPLLLVYAGNSQTDVIFFDSTLWWQIAEKEGIVLMFVCETYNNGGVTISHYNNEEFYDALVTIAKEELDGTYAKIDFSRIYASGQSAGSGASQRFAINHPEFLAAVGSTSAAPAGGEGASNKQIPTMLISGHSDGGDLALCFDSNSLKGWTGYFMAVNGVVGTFAAEDAASVTDVDPRHPEVYAWTNAQGIPMVSWARCLLRPHNCYPSDMPILWDFMKHYSFEVAEDGTVTRYYSASAFEADDKVVIEEPAAAEVTKEQVKRIQATVGQNFYGHKVSKIEVEFDETVTPASLAETTFTVYDRGSANPDFGEVKIAGTSVVGRKVILTVDQGSEKTEDRARNAFGMMNMAGWYMDSEGNLYCGKEESEDCLGNKIYPNTANKTCQGRNLDLILCLNGADIKDGIFSTDTKGNHLEGSVWAETIIASGYEKAEFVTVNVGWECPDYDQVTENGEVPVWVIWPKDYDPEREEPYPVVNYVAGGGVCYWQIAKDEEKGIYADANNLSCNLLYDTMTVEWAEQFPEAIVMSVNNHSANTPNAAKEINAVLDYAIANWNADADKILTVGNSAGTLISSECIRQRPDLYAGFLECNGNFGGMGTPTTADGTVPNSTFSAWTMAELCAVIDNGVSVWMFNGETDGTNPAAAQDTYKVLASLYRLNGKSDEWIYNHVRISGLQSWKFKAWGETDHSVTKVVASNYLEKPYTDVYEGAQPLKPGNYYKFSGIEKYQYYSYTLGFTYTVYPESVSEWVKALFAGEYE